MASRLPTMPSAAGHSSLAFSGSALFSGGGRGLPRSSSLSLVSSARRRRTGLGCRCLFGFGAPELVVIAGVAALVFGPKQLPEIGRSIGKTIKSFQQAAKEFETELEKEPTTEPSPSIESPLAVSNQEDEKRELEASGTKESC